MNAEELAERAAERVREVIAEAERRASEIVAEAEAQAARIRERAETDASDRIERARAALAELAGDSDEARPQLPATEALPGVEGPAAEQLPGVGRGSPLSAAEASAPTGAPETGASPPGNGGGEDAAARLTAMKMALDGKGRDEIASELDSRFGAVDRGALLDDVLARAAR